MATTVGPTGRTSLAVLSDSHRDLKAELGKLRLQKQGLMQDLLTGKVRVTELLKQQLVS